ncbi:hypothetical protein LJC46_04785 [Desulfovibrio sp. OttesenSCG-928-G15]|nr:hypothetical protein [Desulfovibrio sp. OttesenSCG-928-G15]
MPKAKRYSMEQVRDAQKKLRGMASKKVGKTRAETVELLAGDIKKAMGKGHSLEDIRDTLAGAGIQAPLSRLKAILEDAAPIEGEASTKEVTPFISPVSEKDVKKDTPPALFGHDDEEQ